MINVKTGNVKLFGMAACCEAKRGFGFLLFDSDAAYGANAGALIAANAVFGIKVEAIVAVFREGKGLMRVRQGDAPPLG